MRQGEPEVWLYIHLRMLIESHGRRYLDIHQQNVIAGRAAGLLAICDGKFARSNVVQRYQPRVQVSEGFLQLVFWDRVQRQLVRLPEFPIGHIG